MYIVKGGRGVRRVKYRKGKGVRSKKGKGGRKHYLKYYKNKD